MIIPRDLRIYDTSKWHGQISWAMPIEVCPNVIAKAFDATGRMVEDELFGTFWPRMKAIGYRRGSYHFYWPKGREQAIRQAERYVRTLAGDYGDLTYPGPNGQEQPVLAVDFEPYSAARKYGWKIPVQTPAMRDNLHVCLQTIEALTGIRPVFYTGNVEWKLYFPVPKTGVPDWEWLQEYRLWWTNPPYMKRGRYYPTDATRLSHDIEPNWEVYWDTDYLATEKIPTIAPGVNEANIWAWQYSFKGRLPGVNADCDLNWILTPGG